MQNKNLNFESNNALELQNPRVHRNQMQFKL